MLRFERIIKMKQLRVISLSYGKWFQAGAWQLL